MRKILLATAATAALFLTAAAVPTWASDTIVNATSPPVLAPKITVREALVLAAALRLLDGHTVIVKQPGGTETTVLVPWEFGSGLFRLRVANDLAIVSAVEQAMDRARLSMIRETMQRTGKDELKPGTPEYDAFQKQYSEALDAPAPGAADLAHIKASELRLDKNEIPPTVIAGLKPILDMDVAP